MKTTVKKLAGAVLTLMVSGALLAGCGGANQGGSGGGGKDIVKIGMLTNMNASEQAINEAMNKVVEESSGKLYNPHQYFYYGSLTEMQLGLESKSIDEMSSYKSVATYLEGKNPKFETVDHSMMRFRDSFCCAVRKDDTELLDKLNRALRDMKEDGTLDALIKKYITDLQPGSDPPAVKIPVIDGAPTVKIAVTGDLPPLDLVLPNGEPAGFSTAVLAEMAERSGSNVELVQINSGARAAALASKKVDAVFWAIDPESDVLRGLSMDKPSSVEFTQPYYTDDIVHVALKK